MRVEVLYFDGCPTYVAATRDVSEVLSELGMEAEVEMVAVNSDEDAERLRFPGSPTIRVDGRDLFPVPERGSCRPTRFGDPTCRRPPRSHRRWFS